MPVRKAHIHLITIQLTWQRFFKADRSLQMA